MNLKNKQPILSIGEIQETICKKLKLDFFASIYKNYLHLFS